MDQQIPVKKIFNYCFNGARFKTKSKKNGNSESNQYGIKRNVSQHELTTKTTKNFSLHKFVSENNSTLRDKKKCENCNFSNIDPEVSDIKPHSTTKRKKKNFFFSCFKKNSLEEEMSPVKNSPVIVTKLNIDTTVQGGFKKENSNLEEAISRTKSSKSLEPETEPSKHYSHNSVVELMSRDGTLQLYSASTLTPLGSSAMQDEEKIQTHLSISCFHPENHLQYSFSEGSDEVFEASGETSKSLASNLRKLDVPPSKRAAENGVTKLHRNKQCHVEYNNIKNRYPVEDLISADESRTLFSERNEKNIRIAPLKRSRNKTTPVPNHCSSLETENAFYGVPNFERRSCKHLCPPNSLKNERTTLSGSLESSSCRKQDHKAHSGRCCISMTNSIPREMPPVKKWILQMYFNSLVAAGENSFSTFGNLNHRTYPKENKTEYSSSTKSWESQNRCFGRHGMKMNGRNFKTNLAKTKMLNDHAEKENKFNRVRINNVPTNGQSRNGTRLPFREKYRNSKATNLFQDTIYTHYPFIDGPFAGNSGKTYPIGDLGPNCESCIRAVKYGDHVL